MSNYFDASGTIGFTCDNCGRELQGCTWVNGMRFCAKCYQETFGASKDWQLLDKDKTIAEQRKQIADLEAKLAESEEDKNALICDYESRITKEQELMSWLEHNNEELKQQLAEKEQNNKLLEAMVSTLPEHDKELEEIHNQDKISFAVAELEKAKEYWLKHEDVSYYIDNQINKLKEMPNEK